MSIYGYVLFNHKTKLAIKPIYCSVPFHQQFIASYAHSYTHKIGHKGLAI